MVTNKTATVRFQRFAITGKRENRPGTGRLLTFPCVITYRAGADWRLYMTIFDVSRDRPDSVLCPADFTRIKQIFTRKIVYI